ncbi:MAG: TetR/AcrR family transcriptional regulator [Motiliproteus sp.]|jgi:TetR/AcrR family transcriptional regulator
MTQTLIGKVGVERPRRRSRVREAHEAKILSVAEYVFAQFGYSGTAIEAIAERAGMSKQNLLYYFPSKEILYLRVLATILDLWLEKMVLLDQDGDDPATMLENYIRGKIELSRVHPSGSKVFANEIINGAPYLKSHLVTQLVPLLDADVSLVRSWIAEGKMDSIDPYHLFFVIWSSTQTYADFSTQIQLSLKKEQLDIEDFQGASDFLTHMILKGIGLK